MITLIAMANLTAHRVDDHEWTRLLQDMGQHIGGLPPAIYREVTNHLGIGKWKFGCILSDISFYLDPHSLDNLEEGTPRSGCSDPFSIFAFLAFALALMDLMMEMNRKR